MLSPGILFVFHLNYIKFTTDFEKLTIKKTHFKLTNYFIMRKLILLFVFAFAAMLISNKAEAQSNWEAGVRFGDKFSIDATIPFKAPRIHAAAYIDNGFALGGYFDWMFSLDGSPTGLKFYPGVGPEFYFNNGFDFGIAGDFGVEYSFDFPLTLAFDWRPGFMLTNSFNFYSHNWGISARFRFGEGVTFTKD